MRVVVTGMNRWSGCSGEIRITPPRMAPVIGSADTAKAEI